MTMFVLVNECSNRRLGPMLETIRTALEIQLGADVAPVWGGDHFVRIGASDGSCVQADEVAVWIKDSLPEAPGAAGYHDRLPSGAPVEYVSCAHDQDLVTGPLALSVTLSHECIEVIGNPAANLWVEGPGGVEYARELCDAVESYAYEINGVMVSDFLLPSFFDPGAEGPYSFMNKPKEPFKTAGANGGDYQIERVVRGANHYVTARGTVGILNMARKISLFSRTRRLGVLEIMP